MPPALPGFTLQERLGEGGIAEVWLADWRGREVAVKVLRDAARPNVVRRFLREGRMLERLTHPNLVRCLAVLDLDPPVLVLERLRGESLDRRVRRAPLSAAEAERVALDVLRALDHVHRHGIVHRDVKASNVWIEADGRARLLDLGLAADATDPLANSLGEVIGTYAYMSPEHLAGLEVDVRSDLYSLGVTLYEALCGRRPYHAATAAAYLAAHRSGRAPPLRAFVPDLPARLEHLVSRLMAIDPARRPPSAAVAIRELLGEPALALRPPALVGRAALRGAVTACLHAGGVLRVSGEAGSGLGAAARLALELAGEEGFEHAALRVRRRMDLPEGVAALARAVEPITGALGSHPGRVRRAVVDLAAQDPGFLLVVEDVDLALPALRAWLAELAAVPRLRMVLLGARVDPPPDGRLHALRPLTAEESEDLVRSMLGTPFLPPGLGPELHAASAGLPAVLVELVRAAAESGALVPAGDRWTWRSERAPRAPAGEGRVRERWRARLGAETWPLVELAALAGEEVPVALLLRAADADPSGIALGPALREGVLRSGIRDGEEVVGLRRPMLDRALLRGLPEVAIRAGHRALAAAAADGPQPWARRFRARQLALGAEGPEDGRELLALAGRLLADGDAAAALRVADGALAVVSPADAAAVARLRVRALLDAGRARDAVVAAAAVARLPGASPEADAQRALRAECALAAGGVPTAREEAALHADDTRRARLQLARLRARRGDLAGAAEALGAPEWQGEGALDAEGVAAAVTRTALLSELGRAEEAWAVIDAVSRGLEPLDRPGLLANALRKRALIHLRAGRLARAGEDLERAAALTAATATGALPVRVAVARLHLARVVGGAQARALAAALAEEPANLDWETRAEWSLALAEFRLEAGDLAAAMAVLLPAVEAAAAAEDRVRLSLASALVGLLAGDPERLAAETEALAAVGAQRSLAWVLRHAARLGAAPELLVDAEVQARLAEDQVLLLAMLDAVRGAGAREEAARIVDGLVEGLTPEDRASLLATRAARWARGEPGAGRRDTAR